MFWIVKHSISNPLSCNYDIDKIPAKPSEFHRQAFLSNYFSSHIQNNKDIIFFWNIDPSIKAFI